MGIMNGAIIARQLASDYLHLLVDNPEQLEDIRLDNCATKYVLINESYCKTLLNMEDLVQIFGSADFVVFLMDVQYIQLSQTKTQLAAEFKLVSRDSVKPITYSGK